MIRPGLLLICFSIIGGSAGAVPPPPPPEQVLSGPASVCEVEFGIRLAPGERAEKNGPGWWVIGHGAASFGVRRGDQAGVRWRRIAKRADIVRRRLFEWPGGRSRGWSYRVESGGGQPVTVASDHFNGTDSDFPTLDRVRIGKGHADLCGPNNLELKEEL